MTDTPQGASASRRRWNVGRPFAEVILIAVGVFLGLAGEQWRDRAQRHERANEALRRIRAEVAANRDEVARLSENSTAFLHSLSVYYSDVVELEPGLLRLYDEILPRIDRELGR